jgi:small subunit ribosomal protein S1
MTEERTTITDEKSFAELFDESQLQKDYMAPGQKIEAMIVKITNDWIFLDAGGKSEGYLNRAEFADEEGNLSVKEGDTITAYFLSSKHNEKLFTTKIGAGDSARQYMEEVWQNGIPIEGVVEKEIKGGFEVKVAGGMRGFCPYSQMGLQRIDNAQDCIGRRQSFKIIEYKNRGRSIILSSRILQEEQRKIEQESLKDALKEGMIVRGTVVSIKAYGAFLDIGGLQGLLPISAIGWLRVEDIHEHLSVGQELEVAISSFDREKNRISLSLKQMLADPWNDVTAKYPEGSLHEGKVVRIVDFGAFATLESGVDGLIHVSKMGRGRRISHPRDVVKLGDLLQVRIDSIDVDQKRISLSIASEDSAKQGAAEALNDTKDDFRQYMGGTKVSLGSLGDVLKSLNEEENAGKETKQR